MAHYLIYWKPSTVADGLHLPRLEYSASNQYDKLSVGDILWVVTSEGPDDLVLVGRQRVDHLVHREDAERRLRRRNLWDAELYAITDLPEEKVMLDISRQAGDLTFDGVVESLPAGFTGQHLQTMRRLDGGAAALLERLWARRGEAVARRPD